MDVKSLIGRNLAYDRATAPSYRMGNPSIFAQNADALARLRDQVAAVRRVEQAWREKKGAAYSGLTYTGAADEIRDALGGN